MKGAFIGMQCQCGYELPTPLPRFCPQCGTAISTLSPAAPPPAPAVTRTAPTPPPPPTTPVQSVRLAGSTRSLYVMAGLIAFGALTGGAGGTLTALLSLVAAALLVLDRLRPSWYPQLSSWLNGPRLHTLAAIIFVVAAVAGFGLTVGTFFFLPGVFIFLRKAGQQGGLAPFDTKLAFFGWRMVMLVGLLLASFTFSMTWEPYYWVSGYSGIETNDHTRYWVTHSGFDLGGQNDAHQVGAAAIPTLLMLAAVFWIGYRGKGNLPSWFRWVPLGLGALMVLSVVRYFGIPAWARENPMTTSVEAAGPYWFVICLLPYLLGAVALGLGRDARR